MSTRIALRRQPLAAWSPGRISRSLPVIALLALLSAYLSWWCWPAADRAAGASSIQQLVRWRDADHDWLLVIDPATRELVVYDAGDGRPLARLAAGDGLPGAQSIARQRPAVRLPKPPAVAVDGR